MQLFNPSSFSPETNFLTSWKEKTIHGAKLSYYLAYRAHYLPTSHKVSTILLPSWILEEFVSHLGEHIVFFQLRSSPLTQPSDKNLHGKFVYTTHQTNQPKVSQICTLLNLGIGNKEVAFWFLTNLLTGKNSQQISITSVFITLQNLCKRAIGGPSGPIALSP